jgi:hypothetical protein
MKTVRSSITILAVAFSLLAAVSIQSFAADQKPVSKQEFKTLLKTAKEPADHQKIAAYYRQEAARLNATAKEHLELAGVYEKHPPFPAMEAKHGATVEGVNHCKRWAELASEQAKEAEALAALHDGMAKDAEKK